MVALGTLTVWPSPSWSRWRLAVLAGEFGHWLALIALAAGGLAWFAGEGAWLAAMSVLAVGAAGLLLRPVVQARAVARDGERQLDAIGAPAAGRAPFSVGGLFDRAPAPVPRETTAYADELALDFYRAVGRVSAPCVVVVHGGGWDGGDRAQLAHFNHWLARSGYAVAAISYRLAPAFRWPAPRDDVRAAIRFLQARAAELGLDPGRFVLLGRSAGGQIAATTAYAARDPAIRGVVGLYAPMDLFLGYESGREDDELGSRRLLRQYLGGPPESVPAAYAEASAPGQVRPDSPPTLLVHGRLDPLVWVRHSERLAARLQAEGVPQVFLELPWATHACEFNLAGPGGQLTRYALERFLARVTT